MKRDEPEATADEGSASRGAGRAPAGITPPTGAAAAADPAAPGGVRHDEETALRHMTARLKAAYPSVDPSVVDQVVARARGPFRQAKVRTYVPILVERRVRALLAGLTEATAPELTAFGDAGGGGPKTAGPAERSAESPRRSPLPGRWASARLRPAPTPVADLGGAGEGP
ncbi:three-helix bundle dimerization domain-containing protein [Streptomyces sp. NPDC058751]|uniref:three-helix bundle dimerization domain-containing protein n=1 Tax=Streptomyces sp. NPDC058751 TaxID=3346623 RepID=UPI003674F88A